jgi:hypothetical protein
MIRSLDDPRRGEGGGETWAELGLSGMAIGGQKDKGGTKKADAPEEEAATGVGVGVATLTTVADEIDGVGPGTGIGVWI